MEKMFNLYTLGLYQKDAVYSSSAWPAVLPNQIAARISVSTLCYASNGPTSQGDYLFVY